MICVPLRVAIGDLNREGYLDIAASNHFGGTASVLLFFVLVGGPAAHAGAVRDATRSSPSTTAEAGATLPNSPSW